jgi:uncharacterized membrane protein
VAVGRLQFVGPLLGSALVCVGLAARDWYGAGWPWLAFNLALAWVPLIFGAIASRHRTLLVLFGPLWLVFLPNAPYLLTDLVHLAPRPAVPLWFDIALLGGTGALGLAMGVISLRQVATAVAREASPGAGRALFVCVPMLAGFGIWIGRFLRWNSWDLWMRPLDVLRSVAAPVLSPWTHLDAWAFTLTFGALFLASALFSVPRFEAERTVAVD